MARIIVAGYIVRMPLGGLIWTHLQYALGLHRLGHEVFFFEEFGWPGSCFDPSCGQSSDDATHGLNMMSKLMKRFDLDERWVYRDASGTYHGLSEKQTHEIISQADVLLNLSGVTWFERFERIPRRIFVDEDPGFTQIRAASDREFFELVSSHTHLFSWCHNIGQPSCKVPALGWHWHACRQPVVLNEWPMRFDARAEKFTTVMSWNAYGSAEYEGELYGQKSMEFAKVMALPSRTTQCLEVTVGGDAPLAEIGAHGWHLCDPLVVSQSIDSYRHYIGQSRGELSVAKNAYVKTRGGWFSDRSATYLASGKPVVLQDTGYSQWLPVGEGLLPFTNLEEAAAAIEYVNSDYERHCRAAHAIAEEYFNSDKVLNDMLNRL